eukprot:7710474-Pyramimonas_sp.AAC.1
MCGRVGLGAWAWGNRMSRMELGAPACTAGPCRWRQAGPGWPGPLSVSSSKSPRPSTDIFRFTARTRWRPQAPRSSTA